MVGLMFKNPLLQLCDRIYNFFIRIGNNLQSLFILYMRLTWGHQFVISGWIKLHGIHETATYFATLDIALPMFNAFLVGLIETLCGFCLLVGFASRIATIPLIVIMLTALSLDHAPDISIFTFLFQPLSLVRETPYPFLITSILVFCFGPGRISLDAWIKKWLEGKPRY
jgi:putative oxidoreductase